LHSQEKILAIIQSHVQFSKSQTKNLNNRLALVALALISFAVANVQAQEHYRLDPAASEVHFTLGAAGHDVVGVFHLNGGDFNFNRTTGAMSGKIAADAGSGNSDNKSRDKKMTSDQLKATDFPEIAFTPTKFTGNIQATGDSTIQVEGNFTLLGQNHPLSLPMTVHFDGDHLTASGSFTVPFVTWGVKDPSVMFLKVNKEVKIDLKLNGTRAQ
jgi:polyisoprenoid-binding protein YceI